MARKANRGEDLVEYIPEHDGNREDPDPVTLTFRRPTERERRHLALKAPRDVEDMLGQVKYGEEQILPELLVSIENYENADKDANQFVENAEFEFVAEAISFGCSLLGIGEDEAKNSGGSSGSTRPTTRAQSGIITQTPPKGGPEVADLVG